MVGRLFKNKNTRSIDIFGSYLNIEFFCPKNVGKMRVFVFEQMVRLLKNKNTRSNDIFGIKLHIYINVQFGKCHF